MNLFGIVLLIVSTSKNRDDNYNSIINLYRILYFLRNNKKAKGAHTFKNRNLVP